jgi:hypothetical protein
MTTNSSCERPSSVPRLALTPTPEMHAFNLNRLVERVEIREQAVGGAPADDGNGP